MNICSISTSTDNVLVESSLVKEDVEAVVVVSHALEQALDGLARPSGVTRWVAHDTRHVLRVRGGKECLELLSCGVHGCAVVWLLGFSGTVGGWENVPANRVGYILRRMRCAHSSFDDFISGYATLYGT